MDSVLAERGEALINDFETGLNTTWSSSKLDELIQPTNDLPTRTIEDVRLEDLQTLLDSENKVLNTYNLTINVLPGEISTNITVERFTGRGNLTINGAATRGTFTHIVNRFLVAHGSNPRVNVRGFTSIAAINDSFLADNCACFVEMLNCSTTGAANRGMRSLNSPAGFLDCHVSNKTEAAFAAEWGNAADVRNPSGENNGFLYRATNAARISVVSEGTIQHTPTGGYANSPTGGGKVYDSQGRERAPLLDTWFQPTLQAGCTYAVDISRGFKVDAEGIVVFEFNINIPEEHTANGTIVANVPAGYRPLVMAGTNNTRVEITGHAMLANGSSHVEIHLRISNNGNIQTYMPPGGWATIPRVGNIRRLSFSGSYRTI